MSDCFYHPGRDAAGACVNCGKMICLECRTLLGGKIYCQPCADEIFVKTPAKAKAEKPAAAPAAERVSGAWWLLPIFLTWVGGLIAWAVTKARDPKKAKSMLGWGIGLTFLYPAIYFLIGLLIALLAAGSIGIQIPGLK